MERKHIAEEIHFDLKELFEICEEVICKESEYREELYEIDDAEY